MAGRRAAVKAIDWVAFAERIPPNQRAMFNSLKTRSDSIAAKWVWLLLYMKDINYTISTNVSSEVGNLQLFHRSAVAPCSVGVQYRGEVFPRLLIQPKLFPCTFSRSSVLK